MGNYIFFLYFSLRLYYTQEVLRLVKEAASWFVNCLMVIWVLLVTCRRTEAGIVCLHTPHFLPCSNVSLRPHILLPKRDNNEWKRWLSRWPFGNTGKPRIKGYHILLIFSANQWLQCDRPPERPKRLFSWLIRLALYTNYICNVFCTTLVNYRRQA